MITVDLTTRSRVGVILTFISLSLIRPAFSETDGPCEGLFVSRNTTSNASLFDNTKPVHLEIRTNFTEIQNNRQINWMASYFGDTAAVFSHGEIKNLAQPQRTFKAQIRSRGLTSADPKEFEFPKLRVKIDAEEKLGDSIFKGARSFRINTHVSTNPQLLHTPHFNRLNNENAPIREALGLSLAKTLGLATPLFQLARIRYIDSTGAEPPYTRHALLIETTKNTAERLGATQVNGLDFETAERSQIASIEGAIFLLFHRMIGNIDVELRVNEDAATATDLYKPVWNVELIEQDGIRIPIVYDLDASRLVTGVPGRSNPLDPSFNVLPGPAAAMVRSISLLRQHFSRAQLESALDHFDRHRQQLYSIVKNATVDQQGRVLAYQQLNLFFSVARKAIRFKVAVADNIQFYLDNHSMRSKLRLRPDNEKPGTLRPGTAISVLGQQGRRLKVAVIIGNHRDLLTGESEVGYIDVDGRLGDEVPEEYLRRVDVRDQAAGIDSRPDTE